MGDNENIDSTFQQPEGKLIRTTTVGKKDTNFKTIKQFHNDCKKLLTKTPARTWDENFIGEAIADDCHPSNTIFALGAIGGIGTGAATGFFSTARLPRQIKTPFPQKLTPSLHNSAVKLIKVSSLTWRIAKRGALSAILFAVLQCDFKDMVSASNKWKGTFAAGVVCGTVFGARGGLPGILFGAIAFPCTALGQISEEYLEGSAGHKPPVQ